MIAKTDGLGLFMGKIIGYKKLNNVANPPTVT